LLHQPKSPGVWGPRPERGRGAEPLALLLKKSRERSCTASPK
jgi:hypothetical protein